MMANLQPIVVYCQQLIRADGPCNIKGMNQADIKTAFSARLNELCDEAGIPPKGKNRQSLVGKKFKVSQEAARKWLEGESIPAYEKLVQICEVWDVNIEWLYRGHGQKRVTYDVAPNTPEDQLLKIMQHMTEADKYRLIKIGNTLTEPTDTDNDGGDPPAKAAQ